MFFKHELRNVSNIVDFIEKDRVQVDRKYVMLFSILNT